MSNYPPGVTGNEWQIAGPEEREVSLACSSEGFTALTITGYGKDQIAQAIEDLSGEPNPTLALSRLHSALSDIADVDIDGPCPFEGDVTVYQTDGPPTWECPLCRTLHEIEED